MSKQSKWRYIGATEQRLTKIDWKLGFLGLGFGGLLLLIGVQQVQIHNAKVRLALVEGGNTVQARTLSLAPGETMQVVLGQGGYGATLMTTTPATGHYPIYTHLAVMDPSCQVHRQQEPPPSQVRRENPGPEHVLTYNAGTQVWTIPDSGHGGAVVTTTGFPETNVLAGTATGQRLAHE